MLASTREDSNADSPVLGRRPCKKLLGAVGVEEMAIVIVVQNTRIVQSSSTMSVHPLSSQSKHLDILLSTNRSQDLDSQKIRPIVQPVQSPGERNVAARDLHGQRNSIGRVARAMSVQSIQPDNLSSLGDGVLVNAKSGRCMVGTNVPEQSEDIVVGFCLTDGNLCL